MAADVRSLIGWALRSASQPREGSDPAEKARGSRWARLSGTSSLPAMRGSAATLAFTAAVGLAASAGGDAAEFRTGTFTGSRQPDWSISFDSNGRFMVTSAGTSVATGAWEATETNVSLTDDPGPTEDAGKAKTGRYGWQHEWGTLSFTLLRDDSEGRGLLLTKNDWIDSRMPRLRTWVGTYYQNPAPDDVVEKVREMSTLGVLRATGKRGRPDANIMFLGKIMQANPSRISEWMDQLASLPAGEQESLRKAVWYSDSEAGRAWLVEHEAGELANGPRPMLFGDQVGFLLTSGDTAAQLEPHHLDQLWEWFFATGEAEPVIRITRVFGLAYKADCERVRAWIGRVVEMAEAARRETGLKQGE